MMQAASGDPGLAPSKCNADVHAWNHGLIPFLDMNVGFEPMTMLWMI